jgi:LysM repeat protein
MTTPSPVLATVNEPAEVLRAFETVWSSGIVPISLHQGDSVRSAGGVTVHLADGSTLQLAPGTAVGMVAYSEADRHFRVRLIAGSVMVETANPYLEIETPATIAALRPGSFRVVAQGSDATVTVYRGTVVGRAGESEVPIGEGEEVRLSAGQAQAVRWQRPAAPTPAPLITPTPTATPMPTVAPAQRVHIVEQGDTLLYIAAKYKTTVDAITRLNKLDDPHSLSIGQKLLIPPSTP